MLSLDWPTLKFTFVSHDYTAACSTPLFLRLMQSAKHWPPPLVKLILFADGQIAVKKANIVTHGCTPILKWLIAWQNMSKKMSTSDTDWINSNGRPCTWSPSSREDCSTTKNQIHWQQRNAWKNTHIKRKKNRLEKNIENHFPFSSEKMFVLPEP